MSLQGVTVHDLHPIEEVVPSFHAVASAIQERDRAINEAEAERTRTLRVHNRWSFRPRPMLNRKRRQPWPRVHRIETCFSLGSKLVASFLDDAIVVYRGLTEMRLGIAAATIVLKNVNKILIDADQLPGRRHLFLSDPALFPGAAMPTNRIGEQGP